jgi:peptide methionine sulfoxide reductase MsrA
MVDDGMFDELESLRNENKVLEDQLRKAIQSEKKLIKSMWEVIDENKQLQQDLDMVTKTACDNIFLEKAKKAEVIKQIKQQLADAEKVVDNIILETEHLDNCVELADKRESLCRCMDRNHYNKGNIIKKAREYKEKYKNKE